ncbi:hypothetical protein [Celeribacter marinus]|uniref:Uncharacterized protein n=1 Tax=Celeribacter marinus TaxID=1397108 RepID=A0A0N7HIT9_9RHOB|nr:hypothetical protein [Celeribacter marinus]ALI56149.1 hypothetical protein IMCC12053_2202 [Celeribacter marinus]SFK86373.1 hypothetical protein SAMN05444421_109157 [Celeribacter marinus]
MTNFLDVRTRFMLPLWRRILFSGLTLFWGALEFSSGSAGFGMLFLAAGGYLVYQFFIVFDAQAWTAFFDEQDAADAAKRGEVVAKNSNKSADSE